MTNETEEQRMERQKVHLDGHIENPLVRSVLAQDTTFVNEVENFYDLTAEEDGVENIISGHTQILIAKKNIRRKSNNLLKI